MKTKTFLSIGLNEDEKELCEKIIYDLPSNKSRSDLLISFDSMKRIYHCLMEREAIPSIRLEYFQNPIHNIGSRLSKKEVFEKNGTKGEDIFSHPHFAKYLKYFIYGPDLPEAAIGAFISLYEKNKPITSGDFDLFLANARDSVRKYNLDKNKVSEEYYKLAIELGFQNLDARSIRDSVKKMKTI